MRDANKKLPRIVRVEIMCAGPIVEGRCAMGAVGISARVGARRKSSVF